MPNYTRRIIPSIGDIFHHELHMRTHCVHQLMQEFANLLKKNNLLIISIDKSMKEKKKKPRDEPLSLERASRTQDPRRSIHPRSVQEAQAYPYD